jgi:hypothetical protein
MEGKKYGIDLRKQIAHVCLEKEGGVIHPENLDRFLEEVEEAYSACQQYDFIEDLRRLKELGPDHLPWHDPPQKDDGEPDFSVTTP